jgi:hypothetical protein
VLIIEDGSIVPDAEAYATVAEADTYWAERDSPVEWTNLTTAQKEAALRQATEYLETNYCYRSCIQDTTQPLAFPRLPFYDKEGRILAGTGVIPTAIKNANIELALRHAISNLLLDETPNDNNIIREKVGDHEVEYDRAKQSNTKIFAYVEKLLKRYTLSSLNTASIIRG